MMKKALIPIGIVLLLSVFLFYGSGSSRVYSDWVEGTFTVSPPVVEKVPSAAPEPMIVFFAVLIVMMVAVFLYFRRWKVG